MITINTDLQKIIEILSELRSESINSNSSNIKNIMNKYNMLFLGSNFSTIYSIELCNSLNTYFNIKISNKELNALIPTACNTLNMKFEPLVELSKLGTGEISNFSIVLW